MEITAARPKIAVSFEVSLPHDLCASLALSETAPALEGISDWLKATAAAAASPARREFFSLARYCPGLWGRLTRFPADHPARTNFAAFRHTLIERSADDYVSIAVVSLRERLAAWAEPEAGSLVEQFQTAQAARRARLGDPHTPELEPEALAALLTPALKIKLVDLFTNFWEGHYADRWAEDWPRMEASARWHSRQPYSANFESLFIAATGRTIPASIRDGLHGVTRAIFVPSCQVGPYFIFTVALPIIAISFNALTVDSTAQTRPEVVELFPSLKALADETRLQILGVLADGAEHYAQEIMTKLNLSQSAVSRHLALLESSGLLAVRKEGTLKYYTFNPAQSQRLINSLKKLLLA